LGAFFGTAVAKTVGSGLVDTSAVTQEVILCGLLGAVCVNMLTWFYGIPISCSHSLIGGLLGAAIAHNGFGVVIWDGLVGKVIVPMFMSPLIGFIAGFLFMLILLWMFAKASPERINKKFKVLQVFSAGIMAFSHGSNDAQKTMGIIVLSLLTFTFFCMGQNLDKKVTVYYDSETHSASVLPFGTLNKSGYVSEGYSKAKVLNYDKETGRGTIQRLDDTDEVLDNVEITRSFAIPFWVILICALTMGLGTAAGGWKIIRTLGAKVLKLKPIHGFAAETTAATTILTASWFGIPVSTTHVISTAIMGVGSTIRFSAVKWGLVGNIVLAWFLTIPMSATVAAVLYWLFVPGR
jgi:PiT family inorganic phosphate transporter